MQLKDITANRSGLLVMAMFAFLTTVLSVSCTKNFAEYNTDPNALPASRIDHDNVYLGGFFRQMEESTLPVGGEGTSSANAYQLVQNLVGDIFGGYFGMANRWNAAGDHTTYNMEVGWNAAPFNLYYTNIVRNYDTIAHYSANNPDILAVASIIKIHAAHRVVDMFGPIPYFETGTQLGTLGSAYDAVDSIYYAFFDELDAAIAALKPFAELGSTPLRYFDAVYAGNYRQWIRFANSLKLRLAMRIVYADPTRARLMAEEAVADAYGVLTENSQNAQMRGVESVTYRHPLFTLSDAYNETRLSAVLESFLTGYQDPRLSRWFMPSTRAADAGTERFRGIRLGINMPDNSLYRPFSSLRSDFDVIWMPAAEVYFLRAEGALRGWDMGGTAQGLYEEGIRQSFLQWGVGEADMYLQNADRRPAAYQDPVGGNNVPNGSALLSTTSIRWEDGDATERKLERIMTQKWLAMYPNGQEAWSEFRRTGYPRLFPIVINQSGGTISTTAQIKRLTYPASEYQLNRANVLQGVSLLGGADQGSTRLWWDRR